MSMLCFWVAILWFPRVEVSLNHPKLDHFSIETHGDPHFGNLPVAPIQSPPAPWPPACWLVQIRAPSWDTELWGKHGKTCPTKRISKLLRLRYVFKNGLPESLDGLQGKIQYINRKFGGYLHVRKPPFICLLNGGENADQNMTKHGCSLLLCRSFIPNHCSLETGK